VQYGIENKETKQLIGDCAIKLDQYDTRIAEIGITISHLEQKKGYAKEIMIGILTFLFDTKEIHRVVETVDAENIASINLLKSTGFKQEGHFIENIFFKGKWGSEFQYAMLKREWGQQKIIIFDRQNNEPLTAPTRNWPVSASYDSFVVQSNFSFSNQVLW
jgi:ribosomal-protein-alanine N-acetyltransferase